MDFLVLLLVVAGVLLVVRAASASRERQALQQRTATELSASQRVADEDVTRFGEELQRLDTEMTGVPLDEATRQDYQRALDSYEAAKESLRLAARPEDVKHVTEALEDGRYAVACVRARREGRPLPVRRPPCFFNPAHGPSTTDVEWAPHGGVRRSVPVCAADADRVAQGAEPDIRTVPQGAGRVPYWQGGPAYSPWASGYFAGYATSGLLPAVLMMGMLSPGWGAGFGDWDGDGWGGDGPDGSGGFDGAGDGAGWDAGSDFGGGDFGDFGDFGGFDV